MLDMELASRSMSLFYITSLFYCYNLYGYYCNPCSISTLNYNFLFAQHSLSTKQRIARNRSS